MHTSKLIAFALTALSLTAVAGCSADDDEDASSSQDAVSRADGEGKTCSNGVFGTPNWPCAEGLVCEYPNNSTAPRGPAGSSSASTGVCKKPGAKLGETCGNGVFGTPNIPCAEGLACEYPNNSTAPQGPTGSSSAATGTCQPTGAKLGETCGNGVFGTPNIPCAEGLACEYPNNSTAPQGPTGSSSAATGTCQAE